MAKPGQFLGANNPNWRGGRGKGVCGKCGKPTWHVSAKQCRKCYDKQLRERTGPANPEWGKTTSSAPQQGRDRAGRRKELGICEECNEAPAIDRHHIDNNPLNNDPANLKALCRRCHMKLDGRLEAMRKAAIEKNK